MRGNHIKLNKGKPYESSAGNTKRIEKTGSETVEFKYPDEWPTRGKDYRNHIDK